MTTVADGLYQYGGMPVGADSLAVGNVYYVCQTGNTTVNADMVQRFKGNKYKNDHSNILHHTITTALAAVVSKRNDYILVQPDSSDYDEAATLTMDDNNVHLLCPAGMGATAGCAVRAATIDPAADANAITITGRGVEVAGFWIRGYAEKYCFSVGGNGCWVHHNDCGITSTTSIAGGIDVTSGGAGSKIEQNYIYTLAGDDDTILFGIRLNLGSSRAQVIGNRIAVFNGNTMTNGILVGQGYPGTGPAMAIIDSNILVACSAGGGASKGVFTNGINTGGSTLISNNKIAIEDTSNAILGGSAVNCINNMSSLDGGTIAS